MNCKEGRHRRVKRSVDSRKSVTGELGKSVTAGGAKQDNMTLLQNCLTFSETLQHCYTLLLNVVPTVASWYTHASPRYTGTRAIRGQLLQRYITIGECSAHNQFLYCCLSRLRRKTCQLRTQFRVQSLSAFFIKHFAEPLYAEIISKNYKMSDFGKFTLHQFRRNFGKLLKRRAGCAW